MRTNIARALAFGVALGMAVGLLGAAPSAMADPEFYINPNPDPASVESRVWPSIATTAQGFVVAWTNMLPGVPYGQRFTRGAQKVGAEFRISSPRGYGAGPALASPQEGGFIAVWGGGDFVRGTFIEGILGRRYSQDGSEVGKVFSVRKEGLKDRLISGNQVLGMSDGGFIAIWVESRCAADDCRTNIYGRRYDGNNRGQRFLISGRGEEANPAMAHLADGGFVVLWEMNGRHILGQRFNSTAARVGAEFSVTSNGKVPAVQGLPNGGFVVAWRDNSLTDHHFYMQRFDKEVTRVGDVAQVSTKVTRTDEGAKIVSFPDGGFIIVWTSPDVSGYGVFGRRYDTNGVSDGPPFRVNQTTESNQNNPRVVRLREDRYVVAWQSTDLPSRFARIVGRVLSY